MADEHARRTEKLESTVAHLEHQVEQLNSVVIEQGKWLERLKKDVHRQTRAMESLELDPIFFAAGFSGYGWEGSRLRRTCHFAAPLRRRYLTPSSNRVMSSMLVE